MKYWWLKLGRYALPEWRGLFLIGVLMLLGVAVGLLAPWPMKLIVDSVLTGSPLPESLWWIARLPGATAPTGLLAWLAAATVVLFLARRLLAIVQEYTQAGTGSRMVYGLAADLFSHLQGRSLQFHYQHRSGDLIRRVTADTSCVRELVMQVYLPLVTSLVTVLSMFAVMWQLNPGLAAFALALVVPLAFVVRTFAGPMSDRKYREWELQGDISSLAEQTLAAIPIVQAFGGELKADTHFRHIAGHSVRASLQSEIAQHQFSVSTGTVTTIGTAVVMVVGGVAVLDGQMSFGSLLVLVSYFAALYSPIETLAYLSEGFASAAAGARRVFEVFAVDDQPVIDAPDASPFVRRGVAKGISIQFQKVCFGYHTGQPVLREISLRIGAGETVALVGSSGAGKSTLVSLIPRLFEPWEGNICLDGTDIRHLTLASLREQVAWVLQDPFILPLTIAENIAYARPQASREEIIAAAAAAQADSFIRRFPKGYDTIVGERGATLSGGEKQRLSIARALLKDAPVLILDEPTAALDPLTEASLINSLDNLMRDRTTLVIAHRLSTIRHADRIVVIENGRIVEQGSDHELSSMNSHYQQFQRSCQPQTETKLCL